MPKLPKKKDRSEENGEKKEKKARDLSVGSDGKKIDEKPTRTASKPHPRLVNRGASGLLHKLKKVPGEIEPENGDADAKLTRSVAKQRIAPGLEKLKVPIDSLVPDPDNARVHPENNLESIRESLRQYGQVKPIVVRKSNRVVVAGNGTLEAAKSLGWREIAAVVVDMNDVEAAGYGLADNRTAELAKWDFEVVARLDKLLRGVGQNPVGWSDDELAVLRAEVWEEPPDDFLEVGEDIDVEHVCPRCGYKFSGGETVRESSESDDQDGDGDPTEEDD